MKLEQVPTPAYVIDLAKLEANCRILQYVQEEAGCKVLLAQKAYSLYKTYPLISQYLSGTTASGLYEAKLAREEFPGEVHVFAPAFKDADLEELLEITDHIVFNSERQLRKHGPRCREAGISVGLRLNPQCSTQGDHALYDPCAPGSRFGVTSDKIPSDLLELVDGLHFHTLCEQGSDDLETTLKAVEAQFGSYLHEVKWLNMGGGHHITREGYDVDLLISEIKRIRETYNLEVYIEPGEAIALNAGYLATEVLDIVGNGMEILVLDASATCHMPDVLEMPYRPPLRNGFEAQEKAHTYRLSSNTCLTGDVIGDYSFENPVEIGDRLYFEDMAIYSFVKNNTFNGIGLPSLYLMDEQGDCSLVKAFGSPAEYEPHHETLMIWPTRPGSWPYQGKAAKKAFSQIIKTIEEGETVYLLVEQGYLSEAQSYLGDKVVYLDIQTNDAWARDTGPTILVNDKGQKLAVDWSFNAWGGAVDGLYQDYQDDDQVASLFAEVLEMPVYDAKPFVLEGGAIHSDGQGTILVTESCLLSPGRNPHLTKEKIENTLLESLGAEKVIWLPYGIYQDETNEHVDNVAAFVGPAELVLAWTDDKSDPQYAMSKADLELLEQETDAKGRPFIIHKLPIPAVRQVVTEEDLPGYIYEEGEEERYAGERLAGSYLNVYIANKAVLVPQFQDVNDQVALDILSKCFPNRKVVGIPARDILLGGGNIHCITQQIPE